MGMESASLGGSLAALDHRVGETLHDLVQALDGAGLDPQLLGMCAARIEQMVGGEPSDPVRVPQAPRLTPPNTQSPSAPAGAPRDSRERAVLAFTEQYVLDAHGVTDELCAELNGCLSPPELAALTTAIATFEALARSRAVMRGVAQ